MQLEHTFTVPTDVETAWRTLLDVEQVALCMPGAALTSVEGDTFHGEVKVKLGPMSMTYGGKATFTEKDAAAHRAVIVASGSETKGTSTAQATVTTMMHAAGDSTTVEVHTDMAITGKPAQFGRGVMQDVAGRIIDQFAANLAELVSSQAAVPAGGQPVAAPKHAEAINIGAVAGAPVLKRLIPAAIVVVVLAIVIGSR